MIRRREFVGGLGAAVLPVVARGQPMPLIGFLHSGSPETVLSRVVAFHRGLSEAGYVEGRNIEFEHRSAHDQPELFPKLASELADLKVDVIFARGTSALAAAKSATPTIPITGIDLEIDPVDAGFAASIARPGGNITGMFLDLSELSGKHLQILKEILPRASRVAVLGDSKINAAQFRELARVASNFALETQAVELKNATNLDDAFEAAKKWHADSLIVLSSPVSLAHRVRIGELAAKAGLPTIYLYRAHVGAGVSSPTDLTFRICFAVVAFTSVGF